jgi:hypothetical protein
MADMLQRHCEEQSDEAIHTCFVAFGLLRGACHRARISRDPLARNDETHDNETSGI